ncbi:hypothetical protein [Alicycliphilus denitrificans]|uniref:hypothetical protein n=1 Tax=Alicycliphilus denitrificans TaxID=179636 RepID=UPI003A7F9F83
MSDDAWTVSDPVSGSAFSHGFSMGNALARYRSQQAHFGPGFAEAVAFARQNLARQMAAKKAGS